MHRPKFEIHRVRKSEISDDPSYSHVEQPKSELVANAESQASSLGAAPVAAVSGVIPNRPAPTRPEPKVAEEKPKQGFFGQLFSKLFSSSPPDVETEKRKPSPRPDSKPAAKGSPPQNTPARQRSADGKSGETRTRNPRKRGKKKKTASQKQAQPQAQGETQSTTADGKPQRKKTGRKRGGRKKAGKPGANPQNQAQSGQVEQDQAPVKQDGVQNETTQEKQGESSARKPRRRRSPYQTAGVKSRDGAPPEAKDKSDQEGSKTSSVEKALVEKRPQPLVEQAQASPKTTAESRSEKQPEAGSRPETRSEPQARSETAPQPKAQPAEPKPAPDASEPKPVVEKKQESPAPANVVKDQHGVYTLKPANSENPAKENPPPTG
jgi:ribonuclease E